MNRFDGIGRLTRDPEIRRSGDSVSARFSIAINRRYKNKDGEREVDFINCIAFGKSAELIEKHFHKGNAIGVGGEIRTGNYTNREGQKVYTTDVVVNEIDFIESKNSGQQNAQPSAPPQGQYQPQQAPPPQYQQNYQQNQPPQQQYQAQPQPQPQYQQAPPTQYTQQPQQQQVFQQSDPDWMKVPDGVSDTLPFN